MHATHLGDGHPFVRRQESAQRDLSCREALQRHALLRGSQEQVVGQDILPRQACAVDFADALEHVPLVRLTAVHRRRREIGQLVVVPIDRRRWWQTPGTPAGSIATRLRRVCGASSLPGPPRKSLREPARLAPGATTWRTRRQSCAGQCGPHGQSPHGSRPPIDVALNSGCAIRFDRSQIIAELRWSYGHTELVRF